MLSSLEIGGGIIGSTYSWIMEYGIFYRPFGSLFLNSVYSIFGHSDKLIYTFSLAVYSLFIFSVFRLTERLTHDDVSYLVVDIKRTKVKELYNN